MSDIKNMLIVADPAHLDPDMKFEVLIRGTYTYVKTKVLYFDF